jgi:hypothetical protein
MCVRANDIRPLRTASPDYAATEALKAAFRELRNKRRPFFLTAQELDDVFHWKLRGQYGRTKRHRAMNSEAAYRAATQTAFSILDPDVDRECIARLAALTSLHGVGVPVASAILALVDPGEYCVVDFRGWRQVFCKERASFLASHYLRYRAEVAQIATSLGWTVQETDLAIWEYDRRNGWRGCARSHRPDWTGKRSGPRPV